MFMPLTTDLMPLILQHNGYIIIVYINKCVVIELQFLKRAMPTGQY